VAPKGRSRQGRQTFIQRGGDAADLGRGDGDLGAKQPLQDIDDAPGRDPLHVHLGQRQVQGLPGARAALQRTRVEAAAADLGHVEGHFADSGQDGLGLEAVGVVAPRGVAFVGASAKVLGPLHLGNLVDQDAQRLAGAVQAVGQQRLKGGGQGMFFDFLCHGRVPFGQDRFIVSHHRQPARAAALPSALRRTKLQKGCCTNHIAACRRLPRHFILGQMPSRHNVPPSSNRMDCPLSRHSWF
jgi:hypothetical protein